jgi:CO/xanthine dehydrogenase FAD-binding subunit
MLCTIFERRDTAAALSPASLRAAIFRPAWQNAARETRDIDIDPNTPGRQGPGGHGISRDERIRSRNIAAPAWGDDHDRWARVLLDLNAVTAFEPATEATWRDGDAWLGGGTWLFSQPQPRVSRLLDLHAFGWTPLRETDDGIMIAATCTFAQLAGWQPDRPPYAAAAVLARQCCHALLGSFKVHNVATVGGNICLSLPAGPMISLASALDGTVLLRGAGKDGPGEDQHAGRGLPAADFVTGEGSNKLRPGELLTHVWLPAVALRARTAFRQLSLSPLGRSAVVVIARRDPGGQTVVSVTASTPRPVCLRFPAPPAPAEALSALDAREPRYLDDVHGSAPWRAAMTRRLITETLAELAG